MTRIRIWLLTRPSRWLVPCGLFAILYLAAAIVPTAIERLYVGPNQITLEQPYLLRSIAGTREAYNLDGSSMQEREFAVSAAPLTREDLDESGATLQDARIWDWRALEPQLQQIQGLRPYYTFAGPSSPPLSDLRRRQGLLVRRHRRRLQESPACFLAGLVPCVLHCPLRPAVARQETASA
jgi:Uncharacterised protein family (UPF0182)